MTSNKSGRGVVIKDTPEAGTAAYAFADTLRPGTLIVEVNGEDATNFARSDFTRFLDSNTREVTLVVRPDGGLAAFRSHGNSVRLPQWNISMLVALSNEYLPQTLQTHRISHHLYIIDSIPRYCKSQLVVTIM